MITDQLAQRFVLHRISSATDRAFTDLMTIYCEAFPEAERKPFSAILSMLQDPHYYFLVGLLDGTPAGFGIVRVLDGGTAALLEYMAVEETQRHQGIGKILFRSITSAIEAPPRPLFIEIERTYGDCTFRVPRRRRLDFYRSLGARELKDVAWIMPSQSTAAPPEMTLLVFNYTTHNISKTRLRAIISAMYVEVYGQEVTDDRIKTMLSSLPALIELF